MTKEQKIAIGMVLNPNFDDDQRYVAKKLFQEYFINLGVEFNPLEFDDYCDGRLELEE